MAYNENLRIVKIGVQNCYLYPMTSAGFGDAIKQLGMIGFTRKVTQDDTDIYADNRVHLSVSGAKTIEGEITHYQMSPEYYEFLGYKLNANGSLTDSGTKKPFGMAFASKITDEVGVEKYEINVAYNIRGTEPEVDKTTMEDKVEGENLKVSYTSTTTSFASDDLGNACSFLQITLDNASEADVIALLEDGIPMPDTDFSSYLSDTLAISASDISLTQTQVQEVADVNAAIDVLGVTASGGTTPYNYSIKVNGTALTYPTPTTVDPADYNVEITVTDGAGATATSTIVVTVTA